MSMSKLLARIMLAIFMVPAAGMVMTIAYVVTNDIDLIGYPYNRRAAWIVAAVCTWMFVGIYWLLLWRKSVRWTGWRTRATLYSAAGAGIAGAFAGFAV